MAAKRGSLAYLLFGPYPALGVGVSVVALWVLLNKLPPKRVDTPT